VSRVPLSAQITNSEAAETGDAMVNPAPTTVSAVNKPSTRLVVVFISLFFLLVFSLLLLHLQEHQKLISI
jgi:hypothetical protein